MNTLKIDRQRLQRQLEHDEGFRSRPYRCSSGKWTIGIGRNLEDVGLSEEEQIRLFGHKASRMQAIALLQKRGVTKPEAVDMMWEDVRRAAADLDRHYPWWRGLDGVRQEALLNLVFNMGIGWPPSNGRKGRGLRSFVNTMAAFERGDYKTAAAGFLSSAYASQVGARASRVASMIRTGSPF